MVSQNNQAINLDPLSFMEDAYKVSFKLSPIAPISKVHAVLA